MAAKKKSPTTKSTKPAESKTKKPTKSSPTAKTEPPKKRGRPRKKPLTSDYAHKEIKQTANQQKRRAAFAEESRQKALEGGELPHEFLIRVARGEPVKQRRLIIKLHKRGPKAGQEASREWVEEDYYAGFDQRIECAKAAAPFCAPRFASIEPKDPDEGDKKPSGVMVVPVMSMDDWEEITSVQQGKLKDDVRT